MLRTFLLFFVDFPEELFLSLNVQRQKLVQFEAMMVTTGGITELSRPGFSMKT